MHISTDSQQISRAWKSGLRFPCENCFNGVSGLITSIANACRKHQLYFLFSALPETLPISFKGWNRGEKEILRDSLKQS